jgi:hypothetical protein
MVTFIDKFMAYLNEYAYGQIGANVARKKLLTGKVEVHLGGDQWVKVAPGAAKQFVDAAPPEEPGAPPPLSDTPRAKKRNKVNAADFDNGTAEPPSSEEAPKIDMAAVRRRQEADVERAMQQQLKNGAAKPPEAPKKGKGKKKKDPIAPEETAYMGHPELFLHQMEELSQRLDQIQYSSAGGYRELQSIRSEMRDCIAAFQESRA